MSKPGKRPHIYYPESISELLSLRKAHPRSILFAGGTFLMSPFSNHPPEGEIISLQYMGDLIRLNRSESNLEVGPCITIERLKTLRRYLGMKALFQALDSLGTTPIRAMATLGGNIALRSRTVNLPAVLYLLDTRIEIRHAGNSTWIPLRKFYEASESQESEDIITRIRIPVIRRNFERYELIKKASGLETDAFSFYCYADIHKDGALSSFACAYCINGSGIIRNKEMESIVEGKKLPLSEKDVLRATESMEATLETQGGPILPIRKYQALGLLKDTLEIIGED